MRKGSGLEAVGALQGHATDLPLPSWAEIGAAQPRCSHTLAVHPPTSNPYFTFLTPELDQRAPPACFTLTLPGEGTSPASWHRTPLSPRLGPPAAENTAALLAEETSRPCCCQQPGQTGCSVSEQKACDIPDGTAQKDELGISLGRQGDMELLELQTLKGFR